MGSASPWTEEVCQFTAANWERSTGEQIAKEIHDRFGIVVSRAAVVGRAQRMGLATKKIEIPIVNLQARRAEARERYNQKRREQRAQKSGLDGQPKLRPEPFRARTVQVDPLHIPLLELADNQCRYECSGSDEPRDYTFCGHKKVSGTSYCPAHAALCLPGNRSKANA